MTGPTANLALWLNAQSLSFAEGPYSAAPYFAPLTVAQNGTYIVDIYYVNPTFNQSLPWQYLDPTQFVAASILFGNRASFDTYVKISSYTAMVDSFGPKLRFVLVLNSTQLNTDLTSAASVVAIFQANWTTATAAPVAQLYAQINKELGMTPTVYLLQSNNLSDVASASTARTNLGLGTSAVIDLTTDGTLAGDSDTLIPSEKAVKTYVDNNSGGTVWTTITAANINTTGTDGNPAFALVPGGNYIIDQISAGPFELALPDPTGTAVTAIVRLRDANNSIGTAPYVFTNDSTGSTYGSLWYQNAVTDLSITTVTAGAYDNYGDMVLAIGFDSTPQNVWVLNVTTQPALPNNATFPYVAGSTLTLGASSTLTTPASTNGQVVVQPGTETQYFIPNADGAGNVLWSRLGGTGFGRTLILGCPGAVLGNSAADTSDASIKNMKGGGLEALATPAMSGNTTGTITFSGFDGTIPNGVASQTIFDLTTGAAQTSATINLPTASAPGSICRYFTARGVTTVTMGTGTIDGGAALITLAANASVAWQSTASGHWIRIQ